MIDLVAVKAFVTALTGSPDTVMDWRALHDVNKGENGYPFRGSADQVAAELDKFNTAGYGIFVAINQTDGNGLLASNVVSIRANWIDYDNADQNWSQWKAVQAWELPPTFSVTGAIPGKFHAYWVEPAWQSDPARFETIQRKLLTVWSSDRKIIDTPRVMRVPGTVHMKDPNKPAMVAMVPGSGLTYDPSQIEWALQAVNVDAVGGPIERKDLDDPTTKAPSFEWAAYALDRIEPANLGRDDWLKITAAFKTAAFFPADGSDGARDAADAKSREIFERWCARYPSNDLAENAKLWRSIGSTKTGGWPYLEKVSGVKVQRMFSEPVQTPVGQQVAPADKPAGPKPVADGEVVPPVAGAAEMVKPTLDYVSSPWLTPDEQVKHFEGCYLISSTGEILTPFGRYMNATKFNAHYGGKQFALDSSGKQTTDEPWRAATRGQVFRIAKVDHTRFMPWVAHQSVVSDEFGRLGINTYRKPNVRMIKGDPTPFIKWLQAILPEERDVEIFLTVLRHNVQRPGRKMFWAPLIQSEQGAGKGLIKSLMEHALGRAYVHAPNAAELIESGGKFTGWMEEKLMIVCDEIRVDEKRDMVEKLKPMITEKRIEIQAKGADQVMADNVANWIFFSNWKDAIPVNRNDRRYAIFYSTIQHVDDLVARGMDGDYFPRMFAWMDADGAAIVTRWLMETPIAKEFDPMGLAHRAPITSSTNEAIVQSRGRIEQLIVQAATENVQGFRNGWLSSVRLADMLKDNGIRGASPHALSKAYEALGYHMIGRAASVIPFENGKQPNLYCTRKDAIAADYPIDQGYL